jgi:hypothetical protein
MDIGALLSEAAEGDSSITIEGPHTSNDSTHGFLQYIIRVITILINCVKKILFLENFINLKKDSKRNMFHIFIYIFIYMPYRYTRHYEYFLLTILLFMIIITIHYY